MYHLALRAGVSFQKERCAANCKNCNAPGGTDKRWAIIDHPWNEPYPSLLTTRMIFNIGDHSGWHEYGVHTYRINTVPKTYIMEDEKKRADSAEEARKREMDEGEPTLQDTGPKAQVEEQLRGDDIAENEVSHLDSEEVKEADAEFKGKSPNDED